MPSPHDLEVTASVVGFPDEVRYFPRYPGDFKLITKEFVDSCISTDRICPRLHISPSPVAATTALSLPDS
jgi:hypothetical protein